ncbi:MAG: N-acetylglucosamine-6-phosphate deacetylase [Phycisphaerales bacterium]|nr:N-acetylglucosamine-6-phosphate deacetylase [Phycisphaerales bacterium]
MTQQPPERADPGYVDLQVNGYGGIDFNSDALTDEGLHDACKRLRADGVGRILATVITEELPVMCHRLSRLAALRDNDELACDVIAGFHIEGPFINESPGYRGAHPVDAIRPTDMDAAKRLLDAASGLARLVTLAPERDQGLQVTRYLARHGVIVAAGHCDPAMDELSAACDAGLTLFTHLGNGCPMQMHRHDNIIQRVLSMADRLMLCFIADGVHVPLFALTNYLRCAGIDRCIVVTDAIAAAGLGPGQYRLSRWKITVGDDLAARAPDGSHLVGSAMTMPQNAANLLTKMGLRAADVKRLLVDNPARLLRRP